METWKDVPGYEGLYLVSDRGRVLGIKRGLQSPATDEYGYLRTSLCKDGEMRSFYVHRLVALAFIPNPEGKETVNHLNEDKQDNRVENLEWASVPENNTYGGRIARASASRKRAVIATDADGHEYRFDGIVDAVSKLGVQKSSILKCCRGLQHTAGGFTWKRAT